MGQLLKNKGNDIYRMKGVLSVQGMPQRFIFQGVHMVFDGNMGSKWRSEEKRINKLVFIGKNLDRELLSSGVQSCLAQEPLTQ